MRRIPITLFALGAVAAVHAQSMPDLLRKVPDNVVPLLTRSNVLDMVDMHESLMRADVQNSLSGTSTLLALSPDFAQISLAHGCTATFKLLPVSSSRSVICLVTTVAVNDSIGDSSVQFYTTDWTPVPQKKHLKSQPVTSPFIEWQLSSSNQNLTCVSRSPLVPYFDGEHRPDAPAPVAYEWKKGKYVAPKSK